MVSIEEVKKYPRIKDIVTWTVFGYLIGVFITFFLYQFVLDDAVLNLTTSKWIFAASLFLFALCLCYSRGVRCTITLAFPILCSSKGRSLIVAFAFVLVATGPTKNIIDNVEVLTTSMSCGQTQLKEALGRILDVMKRPIVAIKEAIAVTMAEIRSVMKRVQVVLLRIKELVLVVLAGIRNAFAWLGSIISVCNKEFGTPFDRCMRIADDAIKDCRSKLGPIKGLCKVTHLFSMLCYTVKFIDVLCVLVEFFNDAIIQTVMERLHQFAEEIKNMFDVSVTFDHDFYFNTVASKDMEEVGAEIMQDLRSKMNTLFLVFGWLDIIGSILFLTVVIKALYFKSKYLRSLSFNNNYLTNEFSQIDEVRRKNDQELALPLTSLEENKYVWVRSA